MDKSRLCWNNMDCFWMTGTLTKIFKAGPWPAKAKFYFSLPRQPWLLLALLAKAALAKGHPWQ